MALLTIISRLAAQDEPTLPWRWSNPVPHGNNIYDLGFHEGVYWQVTDRGRIYRSNDRTVWTLVESGTTAALRGLAFRGEEVLICGESGLILSGDLAGGFHSQSLTPPTSDWLEAIAASPSLAVSVGDQAAVYLREGGTSWARVSGLGFDDWLRGVAYGADTFVAVGENGLIARSADGRNWQTQRPVTTALNRVVFANDAFYTCGNAGVLLRGTQRSGQWQWEKLSIGTSGNVLAYAAETATAGTPHPMELAAGDLLLRLKSQANGPWVDQLDTSNALPAPAWSYHASLWDKERFIIGGRTGMLVESFWAGTVPGTLWFEASEGPRDWLWDVIALPGQYMAVGDRATILTSENGIEWYRESVPSELSESVFLGIGGSSDVVVAAGSSGSLMFSPSEMTNLLTTNILITLEDCIWRTNSLVVTNTLNLQGLLWYPVLPPPTPNTLQGVTERDGLIVVVGDAGTVLTSRTGSSWTNRTIPGAPNLSSVAAFPGGFVATGEKGAMFHSPDAISWEPRDAGTTDWVYRVRYLDGLLVATGQNGLIRTSPDGLIWRAVSSGTTAWLTDVAKLGARHFVCGTQGTMLVSSNALDWAASSIITGKSLYGLGNRDGQLVAVGVEGVILRALIKGLSEIYIVDYQHDECENLIRDQLVLRGHPDQWAAIERSLNLGTWDQVGQVWFSDSEAAFSLLRTNTVARPAEFFRALPLAP